MIGGQDRSLSACRFRALFELLVIRSTMLLGLLPTHHLEQAAEAAGEWIATGPDPRFTLSWRGGRALAGGNYRLVASGARHLDRLSGSCLYVDVGEGYREDTKLALHFFDLGSGRAVAFVALPEGVEKLRWDPSIAPGRFQVGGLELKRDAVPLWYAGALWALFLTHLRIGHRPRALAGIFVRIARQEGVRGIVSRIRRRLASDVTIPPGNYEQWVEEHDTLTARDLECIRDAQARLPYRPLISVIMPVYNTPEPLLREAIASVRAQLYDRWELCIADDCSPAPHVRTVLDAEAAADSRIRVVFRQANGHISHASNSALELASGEWLAMLDHDDLLRPHALYCMVEAINRFPDAEIAYSDEDKIDETGRRFDPYFKPNFSIDLLLGQNYLNHLTMHRRSHVAAVGGWRPGFEGSQDYDLTLRIIERVGTYRVVHVPRVLYHWRAAAGSTARGVQEKNYAFDAGLRALEEYAARGLPGASVAEVPGAPYYRVAYPLPSPPPLVSIIIPTRDGAAVLGQCLSSLFERRRYEAFEVVIVDNGSAEPETFALFDDWRQREPRLRVLSYDLPFNFSAINNFAVSQAAGSLVCLMNNDIEILDDGWLDEMVSLAVRPDIGCVGAKLHYPNGQIQHGGVVLGVGGVAGHAFKYAAGDTPGYFSHLRLRRSVSAVTAACLLVRKDVYEQVGGLDESALTVAFNDVDFCLKVREAGYRNVWTPFSRMIHHESLTRGAETTPEKQARFSAEVRVMQERWGALLTEDPFYSPNLTLTSEDYAIAFPPRVPPAW